MVRRDRQIGFCGECKAPLLTEKSTKYLKNGKFDHMNSFFIHLLNAFNKWTFRLKSQGHTYEDMYTYINTFFSNSFI